MPNPTMPCPTWRPAEVRQSCVPYVVLPKGSAGEFIQFLKDAFGAIEKLKAPREDGTVMHCEMLLDDTSFMLADATADMAVYPFRHYIYVPDVDAVYTHALTCGGVSETIPADQPYGDRIAGIKDKWGNLWWIGTHMAQPG
jgi:PhnB protein